MKDRRTASRKGLPKGRAQVRGLLLIASWGLFACAPTISRFSATPHEVCPGTPVQIAWRVSGGSAKLTTDPPLRSRSDETYIPTTTTQFILTVEPLLGKPKSRETEATVYTGISGEPQPSEIAFTAPCQRGSVVATAERPIAEWDPRLTVGWVETDEERHLTLSHEGRQATLTAGQPGTQVFDGTKLAGTWSLDVPLLPTESCDGTSALPPDLFIVTAHVRCGD